MEPFEILTSESQERMLAIVHPSKLEAVQALCARWGLRTAVIATLVEGGILAIRHRGEVVAEVPARSLADDGPEYDRPIAEPERADAADPALTPFDGDLGDALRAVLAAPAIASKALGVAAVRPHRPGQHGGGPGVRRRRDPRAEHAEGRRRLERREGPVRPARPLPGRDARGGRVRAQRRGDRCPAARDHELPELRQPRAARGDVAVRGVDPRHPRRVRGRSARRSPAAT